MYHNYAVYVSFFESEESIDRIILIITFVMCSVLSMCVFLLSLWESDRLWYMVLIIIVMFWMHNVAQQVDLLP